ncbi:MAG: hypothetical protein OZSIB_3078 [Candidatus Ozemobacter sibiricus]|uniref:Uncharacterized protein n=1 Tax=Candidatus Ozemobacter sibiricus TaxID=2268124 RepID=A0A367ZHD8_9BACT|nr:MAG: hypothetical protein OZSIB_3078 [Candidatus Ozemobacter sibiricus]
MQPLNLVLNIRDNIPPYPWFTIRDLKNIPDSERGFPNQRTAPQFFPTDGKDLKNIAISLDPQFVNRDPIWKADDTGRVPGTIPPLYMLKSLNSDIVGPFADVPLKTQIEAGITPNYFEENVEFEFWSGVSDNAGLATNTVTIKIIRPDEETDTVTAKSSFQWPPVTATPSATLGLFRGIKGRFPMAFPVTMEASDNALDWTYLVDPATNNPNGWTTTKRALYPAVPSPAPNTRTVLTTLPLFETRMTVRTLDKSLRQTP